MSTYTLPTTLRKTRVGNVEVSTIVGVQGRTGTFAETMLFLDVGDMPDGFRDQECKRCDEADALKQHEAYVNELRAGRN